MLKRLTRSQEVNSDFLGFLAAHPNKNIIFIDIGCRGEPIENWPTKRTGLAYIGIDADCLEVAKLNHSLLRYKGAIKASFFNTIVSNDGLPRTFARSDVGMTDRLIEASEAQSYVENGWRVSVERSETLEVIVERVLSQFSSKNSLVVLKIDVEGWSHDVISNKVSLSRFSYVICEFLPNMPMQFKTMALLESSDFEIADIERAYKYDRRYGRKLFIIDTVWKAKSLNDGSALSDKAPGVLYKIFSFAVFYVVRILLGSLNKKTHISISDAELRW